MAEPVVNTDSDSAGASASYAAYGQLIKMLLPSTGGIAIYDSAAELIWCSHGYEQLDLRQLIERVRSSDTLASRGSIELTSAGVPAFVALLRGAHSRPLGSLVIELNQNSKQTPTMVLSMLRPVLDTLEHRLDLEHTQSMSPGSDGEGLELLLSVDEAGQPDSGALTQLLRHSMQHLGCVLGALLVPDKNLTVSCAVDESVPGVNILDRTQKHLLAWAQLNNRPMVVNRVAGSGGVAPYKILSCPIRDIHARVIGLVALFRAATAEDFELRDIRILEFVSRKAVAILGSQHDSLTGLVNRLIFERRMQSMLDAGPGTHALLYVDIDHLEAINQAFGFQAGDEVIQRVADMIRRAAGAAAVVCRVGGDRFAALLPQADMNAAHEVGARLLAAMAQLGYVHGVDAVPVGVSIGAIEIARRQDQISHLIAAAELACKRAKQQGGGRLAVADESATSSTAGERQNLAASTLQEAFRANDFRLEAQPIVGLGARPGETVGYELLVRMRNSAGALIAPDKFFDAAERYELLPALDRWVLCSAIEALRPHAAEVANAPFCFTLNVSAQSLATRKYATFALEQLAEAGLPPAAFCFELKESAAVNHIAAAEALIRDLTNAGCRIALDDFGSGLSSLAHLKRLPVHYLKIDGRFIRRLVDDRIAESIVSGITRAARTLGVSAIAEHVENAATVDKLRELDVDYGQGFYFGRPQALSTVLAAFTAAPAVRATTRG
ncbi:MAG: EAL domain-containing protein [Gammaproteobacteria bacterium]